MTSLPRSIRQRAVFVDTSALFAFVDATDQWHGQARQAFTTITAEGRPLFTSNLVLAEAHALVMRRFGASAASDWLRDFDFSLVFQTFADHERALSLLGRYRDTGFSYTDAVSFVIMEREGASTAFAFDDHFRRYGWSLFKASES